MRRVRTRIALVSALAVLVAGAGVAVADVTISSQPGADEFSAASFSVGQGEKGVFLNPDGDRSHNVTARGRGPDGRPLFRSPTISGSSAPVAGIEYLQAGTYDFHCTVHSGMDAQLVVENRGTPVARPDIAVSIPRQSLASVRNQGKLKVRVRAVTRSDDVVLIARKGARRIGSKRNLDLQGGRTRVIRLAVTSAGRKALAGLEKAAVSVRASVPFGEPDRAARTLR
jgi:plastocyanin